MRSVNKTTYARAHFNIMRINTVPIAMSPIQGDTAGTKRAIGCNCLLMSAMPTGSFFWTKTSWRACRRACSTAWPAWCKCRPAPACGVGRESEWELHRQTCMYHQRWPLCVMYGEIECDLWGRVLSFDQHLHYMCIYIPDKAYVHNRLNEIVHCDVM